MLKNALWKNPIGWSEKAVGTKFRFWLMISLQIFITFCIVFIFSLFATFWELCKICVIVITGTAFFPTMYLYALSRVLRELSKEKG